MVCGLLSHSRSLLAERYSFRTSSLPWSLYARSARMRLGDSSVCLHRCHRCLLTFEWSSSRLIALTFWPQSELAWGGIDPCGHLSQLVVSISRLQLRPHFVHLLLAGVAHCLLPSRLRLLPLLHAHHPIICLSIDVLESTTHNLLQNRNEDRADGDK
jgi:hypothetical protein